MRKAVVQLGAGPIQRALLDALVRADLVPIVIDRSERPEGLVPGAIHLRAPIDDPAAILRALDARPRDVEPVAVLSSTDLAVASVPAVAAALGLAHASPESIAAMDDKLEAKTRLARAGVDVPRGLLLGSAAELPALDEAAEFVVKPVDSSGSRGVRRVRGPAAIAAAVEQALAFSARVLVEECIEGDHLDINGFVFEGRFELVAVGHRFFSPPPTCVPLYGGIPAAQNPPLARRITQAMQRAVDALDYRHGPIKADAIDASRGLVLIELAARFHGDVFSFHTMRAAGLDPAVFHWLARLDARTMPAPSPAAESAPAPARPSATSRRTGAWLGIFARAEGTIEAIEGLDGLRSQPGFKAWIPRLGAGAWVGAPVDNRALVGFAIFSIESGVSPWSKVERLRDGVTVVLRSNNNPGAMNSRVATIGG